MVRSNIDNPPELRVIKTMRTMAQFYFTASRAVLFGRPGSQSAEQPSPEPSEISGPGLHRPARPLERSEVMPSAMRSRE